MADYILLVLSLCRDRRVT